ncbi:spore coat protein GerQ [Brevibacillus fluminis]|uniref:Spore coat protein GerQ n=1 Tax=Brevibacillus fluminis TaxID=511487 RepID=A0A3M8DQE5_9BACL|nr:spore coat protein GerQ [Brevibacillus fluminis]RNB90302.1 spore coat protein GerQ [Brevibacillus fluminis]
MSKSKSSSSTQFVSYPYQPYDPNQLYAQTSPPFQTMPQNPSGSFIPGAPGTQPAPFIEESYVENILRMNLGKVATLYMTYENNSQWNAKIFKGVVEAAGRDHIIISDPATGRRYLLLTVNLDYITFDEPLNYTRPALPPGVR